MPINKSWDTTAGAWGKQMWHVLQAPDFVIEFSYIAQVSVVQNVFLTNMRGMLRDLQHHGSYLRTSRK